MDITQGNYIFRRFEEQVKENPYNIAVVFGDYRISYRQLYVKSICFAEEFNSYGIKQNDIVGIFSGRSVNLIAAILGLIRIGATYLPIDFNYPVDRIKYMIESSDLKVLLIDGEITNNFNIDLDCKIIDLNSINCELNNHHDIVPCENIENYAIYLIYTSGSTGNPKGALVSSIGFNNLVEWNCKQFSLDSNDRTLVFSSISFDLAQKNLFSVLLVGGTVYLYPNIPLDYEKISEIIDNEHITNFNCTPSMLYPLIFLNANNKFEKLKSLRYVFLGGETIIVNNLVEWQDKCNNACKVVNEYGPTECADVTLYYEIDFKNDHDEIPLGSPIDGTEVYILDDQMKTSDDGELYIAGKGVGFGYINNAELTNDRFIVWNNGNAARLYRTGDFVKKIKGNIYFTGRKDHQIKHKGFRIELLEIENKYDSYSPISKCVVNYNNLQKVIEMFYTTYNSEAIAYKLLYDFGKKNLPEYMIPSKFVYLDSIPMNQNGKIDRYELSKYKYVEKKIFKEDSIEQILLKICKNIKKTENVCLDSNIIMEGFDSLDIVHVICLLERYGYSVSPSLFYRNNSLADIVPHIMKYNKNDNKDFKNVVMKYNCSYYQRKYINEFYKNNKLILGNSITGFEMPEIVDDEILKEGLNYYIESNQIFRLGLCSNNKYVFEVKNHCESKIISKDYEVVDINDEVNKLFAFEFDLYRPPIFVVEIIKNLKNNCTYFLVLTNSVFFDKPSVEILIRDIIKLCDANSDIKSIGFRDGFLDTLKEEDSITSITDNPMKKFWDNKINDTKRLINYDDNSRRISKGYSYLIRINNEKTDLIKKYCYCNGITVNIFFIALYIKVLFLIINKENIVIGETISSRTCSSVFNSIGPYVNQIILKQDASISINELIYQLQYEQSSFMEFLTFPVDYYKYNEDNILPFNYGYNYWELPKETYEYKGQRINVKSYEIPSDYIIRDISLSVFEELENYKLLFRFKDGNKIDYDQLERDIYTLIDSFV